MKTYNFWVASSKHLTAWTTSLQTRWRRPLPINFETSSLENIIRKPRFRKEYLLKTRLTTLERITSNPSYHHYLKEDSEAALSEDVAMIVTFDRTMQKISRYIFPRCDVRGMWPTGESIWNQSMYVKWSKINFFLYHHRCSTTDIL